MFSFYLRFRGGKGVATSLGVVLGIWPYFTYAGVAAFALWIGVTLASRYVSLGSIAALLFAARDKEVHLNLDTSSRLCSFCYQMQNAMNDTAKKKFARELLGTWVKRGDGFTA